MKLSASEMWCRYTGRRFKDFLCASVCLTNPSGLVVPWHVLVFVPGCKANLKLSESVGPFMDSTRLYSLLLALSWVFLMICWSLCLLLSLEPSMDQPESQFPLEVKAVVTRQLQFWRTTLNFLYISLTLVISSSVDDMLHQSQSSTFWNCCFQSCIKLNTQQTVFSYSQMSTRSVSVAYLVQNTVLHN